MGNQDSGACRSPKPTTESPFQLKVHSGEFLPACADGRQVSGEISNIVDIRFSVYHYNVL